jgi:hypothetical protein
MNRGFNDIFNYRIDGEEADGNNESGHPFSSENGKEHGLEQ